MEVSLFPHLNFHRETLLYTSLLTSVYLCFLVLRFVSPFFSLLSLFDAMGKSPKLPSCNSLIHLGTHFGVSLVPRSQSPVVCLIIWCSSKCISGRGNWTENPLPALYPAPRGKSVTIIPAWESGGKMEKKLNAMRFPHRKWRVFSN